jgi:hypothetical protein
MSHLEAEIEMRLVDPDGLSEARDPGKLLAGSGNLAKLGLDGLQHALIVDSAVGAAKRLRVVKPDKPICV